MQISAKDVMVFWKVWRKVLNPLNGFEEFPPVDSLFYDFMEKLLEEEYGN